MDRLTGGLGNQILANHQHKQNGLAHAAVVNGLRNDSYYMATNDTWSPIAKNNSVLIEDDSDPLAPYVTRISPIFALQFFYPVEFLQNSRFYKTSILILINKTSYLIPKPANLLPNLLAGFSTWTAA